MLALLFALVLPQQPCGGPADTARIFAPQLADSARLYRGTFSADGRTLYYFRKRNLGTEDYQVMVSRWQSSEWNPGTRLDLGGDFSDLYPSVSPDGKRLVFSSYRPAPGDTSSKPNAYLWYAERTGTGWGKPRLIGPATAWGSYHSGPIIHADYSIQFGRTSPDWKTTDVLVTRWNGRSYTEAEPAGDQDLRAVWKDWKPKEFYVWGGKVVRNGQAAILDVSPLNDKGRRGPAQMWVTLKQKNEWSEPVLAGGGVNGNGWVNFVVERPDGCSVLFVRDFTRFETVSLAAILAPAQGSPPRTP